MVKGFYIYNPSKEAVKAMRQDIKHSALLSLSCFIFFALAYFGDFNNIEKIALNSIGGIVVLLGGFWFIISTIEYFSLTKYTRNID